MKRLDVMEKVVTCTACELHKQCTAPVSFSGPTPARIVVMGEAPGRTEDEEGMPFVGPAGQLLRDHFVHYGIDLDEVAFINTVSCFPNETPGKDHIRACAPLKVEQLRLADPQFIFLAGKVAAKGVYPPLDVMKHCRRHPFEMGDRVYCVGYHPAAALHDEKLLEAFAGDVEFFAELVNGRSEWTSAIPDECAACSVDMVWISHHGLGWCEVHLPDQEREKYYAQMAKIQDDYDQAKARLEQRGGDSQPTALRDATDVKMAKDAGVELAEMGADPEWLERAWDALVMYLETHEEFHVDAFWEKTGLDRPREARALGPLVLRAAKQGMMEKTGEFRSSTSSNGSEKPVWASKLFA
jgi:uracil-DNA glycosylase family 4